MHSFRKLTRILKQAYPQYTITVRRRTQPDAGNCWRSNDDDPNEFKITIDRSLGEDAACDALMHEFAHCPSYDEWERTGEEHNPVWAYHHGECYKLFVENCT